MKILWEKASTNSLITKNGAHTKGTKYSKTYGEKYHNSTEGFSLKDGKWQQKCPMNKSICYTSTVVHQDKIYAIVYDGRSRGTSIVCSIFQVIVCSTIVCSTEVIVCSTGRLQFVLHKKCRLQFVLQKSAGYSLFFYEWQDVEQTKPRRTN